MVPFPVDHLGDTTSLAGRPAEANRWQQLWQQIAANLRHLMVVDHASKQ
jgi:hypothetical protein